MGLVYSTLPRCQAVIYMKTSNTTTGPIVAEFCGLLPDVDARTRVRQRIRQLLEDRGQTNRALGKWLGHGDQWVSNLLAGRFALSLDEIDRVAAFLNVPPSEIIRLSDDPWELNPTEMRVVRALRMLPPVIRDHLVTLADYLIGATPEEVNLLRQIRQLTADELRMIEHWIDVTLLAQGTEPALAVPADLLASTVPRVAPRRRTRAGGSKR